MKAVKDMKDKRLLPTGTARSHSVPLRLTPDERLALELAAHKKGITLSTYITLAAILAAHNDLASDLTVSVIADLKIG